MVEADLALARQEKTIREASAAMPVA